MLKYLKEPHIQYKYFTSSISVEWYITASNVLSFAGARLDGRFACTNWTLEQALEFLPNCDILKQMIAIKNEYQNKEIPQHILALLNSYQCKRIKR